MLLLRNALVQLVVILFEDKARLSVNLCWSRRDLAETLHLKQQGRHLDLHELVYLEERVVDLPDLLLYLLVLKHDVSAK